MIEYNPIQGAGGGWGRRNISGCVILQKLGYPSVVSTTWLDTGLFTVLNYFFLFLNFAGEEEGQLMLNS